jgi:hypothetical protein
VCPDPTLIPDYHHTSTLAAYSQVGEHRLRPYTSSDSFAPPVEKIRAEREAKKKNGDAYAEESRGMCVSLCALPGE